jgi:hypothetical protein
LKRAIFLPCVRSRKCERLWHIGRDFVIGAGRAETELQHLPQFAVDWSALSMTGRPIGGIFVTLNLEPLL